MTDWVPPFRDDAECMQAWFEALGPMSGASSTENVSGIVPVETRLPVLRGLTLRIASSRNAGLRMPLFDAFDAASFDLLDRLLCLALLRDSFDARSGGGLWRAQLCDAAGAAAHFQQEAVRARLEDAGAMRRLGLVQSDADPNLQKRYYRISPAGREALLRGETTLRPTELRVPKDYPAFAMRLLEAAQNLLSAVVPVPGGLLRWADPIADGPGWDLVRPQQRRFANLIDIVLSRRGEPFSDTLRQAGIIRPVPAATFALVASLGDSPAGVSMAVLEVALKALSAEPGGGGCVADNLAPDSALVRNGLVRILRENRSEATAEVSIEKSLYDRLFPHPIQVGDGPKAPAQGSEENPIEKVAPRLKLDGVVLPVSVRARLDEALTVPASGASVASEWGLGEGLSSPAGVALLFHGPPGTGKTLAAEAVAGEMGKTLWIVRIDRLLSRYIGDTEKAIAGVFRSAAETGDVVLLDEADSLLGDRAGSQWRWEITQVNVLLQEIERFRGVVILTTNRDHALDPALERRLLARIEFALPGETERAVIWRKHLPPRAPLAADIDLATLAHDYPLSGSFIRTAAFFASLRASRRAEEERLITQRDLSSAAAEQLARSKAAGTGGARVGFAHAPLRPCLTHPAPDLLLEGRQP